MNDPHAELKERNRQLIEDYRQKRGKVGPEHDLGNRTVLLLTTTGAKSGREHTNPLTYLPDQGRFVVFASFQGSKQVPDWYANLVANPEVTVEVGDDTFKTRPKILKEGPERDRLFAAQVARQPQFGEYEKRTTRVIPAVILERPS